jgi:hypothetical protein
MRSSGVFPIALPNLLQFKYLRCFVLRGRLQLSSLNHFE